jgi:hypothetical protein
MNSTRRANGKLIRKVSRLDKQWRREGMVEGKVENALAWRLGQAYRAGLGGKARAVQARNAA